MLDAIPDLATMRTAAGEACSLMKTLSNPDRLLILCQLAQGERRVGELESMLGIAQPTLSQQLTVLRNEQLVATRREGKHIYYSIASHRAMAVIDVLYGLYCGPADARSACGPAAGAPSRTAA